MTTPHQTDLFAAPVAATMESPPCVPAASVRRPDIRARMIRRDVDRTEHSDTLRRLEPLAVVIGAERAEFTVADVRDEAERRGILTGQEGRPNLGTGRLENPRALAYLGALLPGLARIGFVVKVTDGAGRTVYDTSARHRANGNKQALWRLTDRGRSATIATAGNLRDLADVILAYRESGAADHAIPPYTPHHHE